MNSTAVTPDQSDDAPNLPTPNSTSSGTLASALGSPTPSPAPVLREEGGLEANAPSVGGGGGSRLGAILSAVASTVSTGLAGIAPHGRPSFVNSLGGGARAEQEAQQVQQGIRFKTFDDQVRLAELTHQDAKMQLDNQAQQDAHQEAELRMRALAQEHGWNFDVASNHGPSVMDNLKAQTAATGSASVPPGTRVSADGNSIFISHTGQDAQQGQTAVYKLIAPSLGLPALTPDMDFVPPKYVNMMTNKLMGFKTDGSPFNHDDLPGEIGADKARRDMLAKNGASDAQLGAMDSMIKVKQANLDALDAHKASVEQQGAQAKNPDLAPVTPDALKTFTETTLSGYSHISPGVANGLKAEAAQAKTQADLNKVQAKAITMEQSGQVHADTVAATQAGKQTAQQNAGLVANEKLLNDPHAGALGALTQLSQVSSSIKAGQDGNALLTNMLPTMEVLGINHTAGITRISPAEAEAAGTSPDWATRWNAFATKAATGKLTDEMATEGNQLVGILKQGALTKLYQQQSVIAKGRGIDPSTIPSVDANGSITTFDKVKMPTGNTVSLAAARQLPAMKGMSDDQIKAAIQAQGHMVGQ